MYKQTLTLSRTKLKKSAYNHTGKNMKKASLPNI